MSLYRRELFRYLLASPLWAGGLASLARAQEFLIDSPADAVSVFDFEDLARTKLPPAHWGYLATGVDDDRTLARNREAFSEIQILARRLVDVTQVDMSVELFGTRWETPIVLCPVGSQRAFHPDGELAVAEAAREKKHLQILSTMTTASVEDVTARRGAPVWYQLYPTASWKVTESLLKRAEAAGCPAVALTVDIPVISHRETAEKLARIDSRDCSACHEEGPTYFRLPRKPMFDGLDLSGLTDLDAPAITWSFIERMKQSSSMKVLIKGIVTGADARLAVENGADGIIVSNHGGRAEESVRSTIESLPEVIEAVSSRIPVIVDSGFRRGTDIFKALALGASAVGIGRPYIWGLASFGREGVVGVLDVLRTELALAMRLAGATSVAGITRDYVRTRHDERR